ncbi:hypothetical protein skT53_19880 [Effusibacillus dendaii]|uniref:Uncharacterized protein n=1 Tax=Effusibacillus dendaii TaxID=2743772 RepID=A0A7I8DA01_9BACL|nr:hypothetical protein skT53_19880 [Effusibacillus dendaii]
MAPAEWLYREIAEIELAKRPNATIGITIFRFLNISHHSPEINIKPKMKQTHPDCQFRTQMAHRSFAVVLDINFW